jgi:hypothetical protein
MFTENDFRELVSRFKWTFAKTYADKAPHEYIALNWVGHEHKADFISAARFIREAGFKAFYYKRQGFYYILDDKYYWTMDERAEDTDLINRAKLADYELIDNSWRWKGQK